MAAIRADIHVLIYMDTVTNIQSCQCTT